jgi:hypothetical protein
MRDTQGLRLPAVRALAGLVPVCGAIETISPALRLGSR